MVLEKQRKAQEEADARAEAERQAAARVVKLSDVLYSVPLTS